MLLRADRFIFYLQASHADPHGADNQQVISQKLLQLGDAAALQRPEDRYSTEAHETRACCWSTDLHPVDVGGVVPPATHGGDGFTAAVGDHPACRLT